MGQQDRTLLSPKMFRELVKPRFARLYAAAKSEFLKYNPNGKIKAQMDHGLIKREYRDRLSFHGSIDIQGVLPFGTPEEVKAEASKVMRALGPRGGYILAPTRYVLPDIPPENIIALWDAVLKSGKYPL